MVAPCHGRAVRTTADNLTVANTASPSHTLKAMTVVAVITVPVVLLYQGWSLYIFGKRITTRAAGSGTVGTEQSGSGATGGPAVVGSASSPARPEVDAYG